MLVYLGELFTYLTLYINIIREDKDEIYNIILLEKRN